MPPRLAEGHSTEIRLNVLTRPDRNVYLCDRHASLVGFVQVGDGDGRGTTSNSRNPTDSPAERQLPFCAKTHCLDGDYVTGRSVAGKRLGCGKRHRMVAR